MPFQLFSNFTSSVDVTDQRYLHYQRKRLIPFSKTPFKQQDSYLPDHQSSVDDAASIAPTPRPGGQQRKNTAGSTSTAAWGPDQWDDEPVGERPPGWLELSGDLAWTATFSSLTSNTEISTPGSVVSYGVFFSMAWQLWASQATYDIKFYTNDWWHRIFFILQLMVYGGLASFTSDFDVFWGLSKDGDEVFVGDADTLTAQAIINNQMRTKQLSFQGIALVMAISRALLLVQYLRVTYYRSRHRVASWLYMLTPISIAISSALLFSCFAILKVVQLTPSAAIVQLLLWASAMVIEILGHAFTPDDSKQKLRGYGSITGRLSTLTVIVIGEGLNGLCSTLRHSVNSLGFGFRTISQIAAIAVILYLIWLLYFDGFKERLPPRKLKKEIWLLLHLPFHLSLILLLEGLKNTLLYTNLLISSSFFMNTLGRHAATEDGWKPSPEMDKVLQKLDLSWTQQIADSEQAFKISPDAGLMQYWRWVLTVMYKLLSRYDETLEPKAKFWYDQYMKDDNFVKQDIIGSNRGEGGYLGPYWNKVVHEFEEPLQQGTTWVIPAAGVVILCIGLLNYVQSRPRDRYAWGSFFNKVLAGIALIALMAFSIISIASGTTVISLLWFMPTIAITLSAVAFVDMILLNFLLRSARKRTGEWPPQTPQSATPGQYDKEYLPGDRQSLLYGQASMGHNSTLDVSAPGINSYPPAPNVVYASPPIYGAQDPSYSTVSLGGPNPLQASSSGSGVYSSPIGAYDPWNARR